MVQRTKNLIPALLLFFIAAFIVWVFWVYPFLQIRGITDDLSYRPKINESPPHWNYNPDFAIWPTTFEVSPGKMLKIVAAARNTNLSETFFLLLGVEHPEGVTVTYENNPVLIPPNEIGSAGVDIAVPASFPPGEYLLWFVGCKFPATSSPPETSCTQESTNLWDSAEQFTLVVV